MKIKEQLEFGNGVLALRQKLSSLIVEEMQKHPEYQKEYGKIVISCLSMMFIGIWKQQKIEKENFIKLCDTAWDNYEKFEELQ